MPGRWMDIHDAFARAVEIEGVPELAFQRLCPLVYEGKIKSIALRRTVTLFAENESEARINEFEIDTTLWSYIFFRIDGGLLMINDFEFDKMVDEEPLLLGGNEFDPFYLKDWRIAVSKLDLEDALAKDSDSRPSIQIERRAGGRPQKYDWAAAGGVTAAYITENDPQEPKDLESHLVSWFSARNQVPDKRDIERFASTAFDEGKCLKSGRKAVTRKT